MPSFLSSVQTLQEEIAIRLNETGVSATEAATYLGWINMTTQDVALSFNNTVPFLETSAERTLSAGTRIYGLPSDFDTMYSVVDPQEDRKLTYVNKFEFDLLQPSAAEQGDPSIYTLYMNTIEFYPQIGSTQNVKYYYTKTITTVSAASATPQIPGNFAELYVLRGVQYGLERRGDYQQAQAVNKRYEDLKATFIQSLKTLGPKRIHGIREFNRGFSQDPIVNLIQNA